MSMFKHGDRVSDRNVVYKVVRDDLPHSCSRCDFFKNKTKKEQGIPCSEMLHKKFRKDIIKLLGKCGDIKFELLNYKSKIFSCQEMFGNSEDYDGVHLEQVFKKDILKSWKKIISKGGIK